jgi:hypothetical protein
MPTLPGLLTLGFLNRRSNPDELDGLVTFPVKTAGGIELPI